MLLPGCAVLTALLGSMFEKPTLTFQTARLKDVTLSSVVLETVWQVDNPNSVGVSVARSDCRIFVEEKPVAAGGPPAGFTLPANGRGELVFPASVRFGDVLPAAQAMAGRDRAHYRVEGTVGLDTPIGIIDFVLDYRGEFEVPKLPAVAFGQPRVKALTLAGATLELPLVITNRNGFPLPLEGVTGSLRIGGASVGTISTGELGTLAANERREVNVPLTLNVLEAGEALRAALEGQSTSVEFQAELLSGGERVPLDVSQVLQFAR